MPATLVDPGAAPSLTYEIPDSFVDKVRVPPERRIVIRECIGRATQNQPGPQAFLVEVPPDSFNGAHFHPIDQFQVFFGSDGAWYQRQDVDDVLLHYTDAYSTYGPFGSRGPESLRFFTLRAVSSVVTAFMPEDRDKLIRRGRRNYHRPLAPHMQAELMPGRVELATVIEPEPDGLAAYLVSAGPGVPLGDVPLDRVASGQYHCVVAGSVRHGGQRWGVPSLAWRAAGEPPPELVAGDGSGCRVLVMQIPAPTAPRADADLNDGAPVDGLSL